MLWFSGFVRWRMAFRLPTAFAQAPPGPIAPSPQEQPAPGTPEAREAAKIVTAYTLPPDLYAKTKHLEKIKVLFFTLSPVYGILLLWLLLRKKVGPKYRDWAEGRSGKLFLQVLIFAPLLVLTLDVLSLPLSVFEQWELRNYGLSVQALGLLDVGLDEGRGGQRHHRNHIDPDSVRRDPEVPAAVVALFLAGIPSRSLRC